MLAVVYPGQGSQRVGMGADLRAADPALFDRHLNRADEVSGLEVRRHCLDGPPEALTRTDVAQPALFALSLAITDAATAVGVRPDFAAGHSLGEYTAAVAAGALGVQDGMRVVAERGRLMAKAQSERPGAMAAIIGLSGTSLDALCRQASEAGTVGVANLNSPTQSVVSGEEAGVERLLGLAEEAGATRAIRLQVGAAFHSELMRPVQRALAEMTRGLAWRDPLIPLAANATGALVSRADELHEALLAQIASPVRWVECVRTLVGAGCTAFLELGPGRVLTGLIRQIAPEVEAVAADSPQKLAAFAEAHPAFAGA